MLFIDAEGTFLIRIGSYIGSFACGHVGTTLPTEFAATILSEHFAHATCSSFLMYVSNHGVFLTMCENLSLHCVRGRQERVPGLRYVSWSALGHPKGGGGAHAKLKLRNFSLAAEDAATVQITLGGT